MRGRSVGRLGLIAGGGGLPLELAHAWEQAGQPPFVVRLKGFADAELTRYESVELGMGEFGRCVDALRKAGCGSVCLAGVVGRPDFGSIKLDWKGVAILPGVVAAARRGDDALLSYLLGQFEHAGFVVLGAHEAMAELVLGAGALGVHAPRPTDQADMMRALEAARRLGELDIGQGAVVCDGLVLAVEAAEGTDRMLARVAELAPELRGAPGALRGVLAKAPKPRQDRRVDLPTIGPRTIQACADAGLAGVVAEAGAALVVDRRAVVDIADRLGVFVWGEQP